MTNIDNATRAAEILRRVAQDFRAGSLDFAHKRMNGAGDFLARAGETAFAERITALGYMFDMPGEYPATVADRIADEVDALISGGHIE